jgi:hypothetical protein
MPTQIRVPTGQELRESLGNLDALLTAKKWARAAIVFAHTEVQTNKGSGTRPGVSEGKWNIRHFAELGFAGLTTNKAVSRYRDAWIKAIDNGWAVPVEPGQMVSLPDQDFPAWPYGAELSANVTITEMGNVESMDDHRRGGYTRRPVEVLLLEHLDKAVQSVATLGERLADAELDDTIRAEIVEKLTELQRQTREAIRSLRGLKLV